jgi:hypothetical protein
MRQSVETIGKVKEFYHDKKLPLYIRGRVFDLREIRVIHQCIEAHFDEGRTKISQAICEKLNWRQPNGWLKDRACRDVLLRMMQFGLVELPPAKTQKGNGTKKAPSLRDYLKELDLETPITDFPSRIRFEFAKGNKSEALWNQVVEKYHYLGHKVAVGNCIKYLIWSEHQLLGAISFSSASWHLRPRNEILHKLGYSPEEYRNIVINNTRFLILPNIAVKHLASKLLSMATRQVVEDWTWYYSIKPQFVETFVEPSLFNGTCYKAANWIEIGVTKGYAKSGSSYRNSQEPKTIYIFGLNKRTRRSLRLLIKSANP